MTDASPALGGGSAFWRGLCVGDGVPDVPFLVIPRQCGHWRGNPPQREALLPVGTDDSVRPGKPHREVYQQQKGEIPL